MARKKTTRKKTTRSRKSNASTEQLRKEAIAQADRNIAEIDANERGEQPPAESAKPKQKKSPASPKGAPGTQKAATAAKPAKTQRAQTSAAKTTKTKVEKAPKPAKDKRRSGLDYAAQVLASSKEPLTAKVIAERAIAAGWKTNGATPHATLYAAMIREITVKGSESRFKKIERGQFTTRT